MAVLSIFPHTIKIGVNGIIPPAAMILTLLNILEGVLILRNSSRKFKTVVDNAILRNIDVSSENISERIKIQTENGFYLKALFPTRVGKGK